MKKSLSHCLRSGTLVAAAVFLAGAPAKADRVICGNYQPGLLAYITQAMTARTVTQCAAYQGDYMVDRGPSYSGPAVIEPQATYAPTRTAAGYPYVHGQYQAEPEPAVRIERKRVHRRDTVKRIVKRTVTRHVVNVKNDLPPRKGGVQIVRARAEVRIYGPERMDIKLYRR